jgi:hypothetical protein
LNVLIADLPDFGEPIHRVLDVPRLDRSISEHRERTVGLSQNSIGGHSSN